MTEMERRGCLAISPDHPTYPVRYQPGSYDKRFAQSMAALARRDDWADVELSPAQVKLVWKRVVAYRRQIKEPGIIHYAQQQLARIEQDELAELGAQQVRPPKEKAAADETQTDADQAAQAAQKGS